MNQRKSVVLMAVALLVVTGGGLATASEGVAGAIYTMTNSPAGNEVVVFDRLSDGALRYASAFATGGLGSGDGLGNQGGVVLSGNNRWLLAVNAGSDEISVFSVDQDGLRLTDTAPSGGRRPVSAAVRGDLVYVVHAGGSVGDIDSLAGLRLEADGALNPLPGSIRPLSAANTAPAQVGFSPDGRFVLVTEKATNTISVYPVDEDGYLSAATFHPSSGQTPFSFDFGKRDQLFVSEVFGGADDAGAVSSYALQANGHLDVIDGSIPNTETAPCWLVVTRGGRYVFTTNTPDDSLSAYSIDFEGRLTLLDEGGRSGEPGAGTRPLDMDLSDDGRFLYTLNIGEDTIGAFRIEPGGSLRYLGATGGAPDGANGLAAR